MKVKILTLILVFISNLTFACSCEWRGNFIKSSKFSQVIIKAKVVEKLWHFEDGTSFNSQDSVGNYFWETNKEFVQSIKIEVLELIKGEVNRRTFEIYGSNGYDCRESIRQFEIDKIYILGLYSSQKNENSQPNEDENDYVIGGCSEKWLEYLPKSDKVFGYIFGSIRKRKLQYSYQKLVKRILS
ncbi:hypothetical protein [Aureibacter tunicatorum]|uniref:Tissue inhibitor of metalloproteinase n=1 Tax=Aureibacter tunicatorum TaxID=866807 RepID=A0AAE4BSY2_9BACT|nr:hypothetical protein [Aureibacter tunicatorum]MDR6238887.1 hypothetical protein [Aureibacter tunicatorum]BDD05186.1 hypothetical protein AUTU_26690 [Aureibacter tunicatorum]